MSSFDRRETIRVVRDEKGVLAILHGATKIATIKQKIGGGWRVETDERAWRLSETCKGWTSDGDPRAELRSRLLGAGRLTIGADELSVRGKRVKGPGGKLLTFTKDKSGRKPSLKGTIVNPPRSSDPEALIVLATTAVVLGVDLEPTRDVPPTTDNRSAALHHSVGTP